MLNKILILTVSTVICGVINTGVKSEFSTIECGFNPEARLIILLVQATLAVMEFKVDLRTVGNTMELEIVGIQEE
jgi:hypothetical protein